MRLYSHVVTHDHGLAPNPFWGYCTVAVCTLNHMGVRASEGDWLVGTTPASRGDKLVYAMRVSEVLSFDEYYRDSRFQKKKPDVHGTWRQRCGDNMYYRDETGKWRQCCSLHHRSPQVKQQDRRHPRVFIAEHFYYFGDKAPDIPSSYAELIWRRQGCKCRHNPAVVDAFLDWLQANFEPGVLGIPHDNYEAHGCACG